MDSGFGTNLEGFLIHGNLSLNPSYVPIVDGDGSLEASGTIYIDKIREYNNQNGIDNQNVIFNNDSVEIPFSNPSDISSGTLLLNGGITLNNTSDSISLTSGGTLTTLGGVSIGKKLNGNPGQYVPYGTVENRLSFFRFPHSRGMVRRLGQ